jgi:hypothetical protein
MPIARYNKQLAAQEHLLSGSPLTDLEAQVYFGMPNIAALISQLRRVGWVIHSRSIPMEKLLVRINKHAVVVPHPKLPVQEIRHTEYWLSR